MSGRSALWTAGGMAIIAGPAVEPALLAMDQGAAAAPRSRTWAMSVSCA